MLNTPLHGFTILLPKVLGTVEMNIFKAATVMISYKNTHKDALIMHRFVCRWMLRTKEGFLPW